MKFLRIIFLTTIFIAVSSFAFCQNTTVSGTVTDPDSFNWAGGSIQFALYNSQGGTVTYNGVALTPNQLNVNTVLNSGGAFSVALNNNLLLQPVGTQWNISVCPAASSPCQTLQRTTISGSTLDLTTAINSQIKALRFSASYTARAYGQVEISPVPPAGGTYYDITLAAPKYWNGAAWVIYAGNTGGNPHAPVNSIQTANSALNAFNSDSNFLINSATHTRTSTANDKVNSFESVPRNLYDPMDTKYNGGLAAAIAGTSGFTPDQVIQSALDFGYCQFRMGLAPAAQRISLPVASQINLGQVKLWPNQELSGDSLVSHPTLQHIDGTKIMITTHASGDSITCSNSTTYTSGPSTGILVSNLAISGMGAGTALADIGIKLQCAGCMISHIAGVGNIFGEQGVWMSGINNFMFQVGYISSQINGCASYVSGGVPISNSPSGVCGSIEEDSGDNEDSYFYASDSAQIVSGHHAGACYPKCAAIVAGGNNGYYDHLFGQVSDIDILLPENTVNEKISIVRADATSREGVRIGVVGSGGSNHLNDVVVQSACTDTALKANYDANIKTGCSAIKVVLQANTITDFEAGSFSIFGPSFEEGVLEDALGANNRYAFSNYGGNPDFISNNDQGYVGFLDGSTLPTITIGNHPAKVSNGTTGVLNANSITSIGVNNTTPITNIIGGFEGQDLTLTGVGGATVVPDNQHIFTCTGLPEQLSFMPITFRNYAGYVSNSWREICNTPQNNYVHLNWTGNPIPTNKYIVDFYGNGIDRQVPNIALDVSQLHGPTVGSGQYCFVEEAVYADGNHNVSQLACTSVDLANPTAGVVFITPSTQVVSYKLCMVSNTTGSSIPVGRYPPPTVGGPTGFFYAEIPDVVAGGDGTACLTTSENNTGMFFLPWGSVLNTTSNTQPPCTAITRGRQWLLSGGGTGPDTYQICEETTGATFAWISH